MNHKLFLTGRLKNSNKTQKRKTEMKLKAILAGSMFLLSATAIQASATTIIFDDNPSSDDKLINFPKYNGNKASDEIGTPKVESLTVNFNEITGFLETVVVDLENRRSFDSLFINTNWDKTVADWESWDYFVRDDSFDGYGADESFIDGSGITDTENQQGLYSVKSAYEYTNVNQWSTDGRDDHANGFTSDSLDILDQYFAPSLAGNLLTYNFVGKEIDMSKGFTIAYGPWCMNDIAGGSAPVPEPATMLLFGTGLIGLAGLRRKGTQKV